MIRALITGITGQDGSYLADFLLGKPNYEVHGLLRSRSVPNRERIAHLGPAEADGRLRFHHADLNDASALIRLIDLIRPDEVYNLAAQSHVRVSFDVPIYTAETTGMGALRLLEAIRRVSGEQRVKFYQASSAEMFGSAPPPQTLRTPFHPRSPYGCAKLYAHWQTVNYREAYGLFACSGILFNHESPRRGEQFVSRKITRAAARIKVGLERTLAMGNLDARRDWGFAGDYVRAMWMMLQQDEPDDYLLATGQAHSVRQLLEMAFGMLDLDYRDHVTFDPTLTRPAEVDVLIGDATKARDRLGWRPEVDFPGLVRMMVENDLDIARGELAGPIPGRPTSHIPFRPEPLGS
ncbi:MAG: gmd [Planctomycetota bacterium]|nr:gmd [Planctomycetota bacterium]